MSKDWFEWSEGDKNVWKLNAGGKGPLSGTLCFDMASWCFRALLDGFLGGFQHKRPDRLTLELRFPRAKYTLDEKKTVVEETLTNMIRHFGAVAEHEKGADFGIRSEPTCYLCPHCEHHFSLFPEIDLQKIYCPKCSKALYGMLEVPEPPHDAEPPVILDPSGRIQISCIHCDREFFVDPGCNLGTTFCPDGCGRQGPAVGKPTEEPPKVCLGCAVRATMVHMPTPEPVEEPVSIEIPPATGTSIEITCNHCHTRFSCPECSKRQGPAVGKTSKPTEEDDSARMAARLVDRHSYAIEDICKRLDALESHEKTVVDRLRDAEKIWKETFNEVRWGLTKLEVPEDNNLYERVTKLETEKEKTNET